MRVIPQSTINIYSNVMISKGNNIAFKNAGEQKEYFSKHLIESKVPCTVVRKSNVLRIEPTNKAMFYPSQNPNYISFRNPNVDEREYYGIITNWDYVNENCIEIAYAIDYFQTYCFDMNFSKGVDDCLVVREHLSQADYAKSLINPYDPSILEFQTGENLETGYMLEDNVIDAGTSAFSNAFPNTDYHHDNNAILYYISPFDVNELGIRDDFFDMLNKIVESGGFYLLPGHYVLDQGNSHYIWRSKDSSSGYDKVQLSGHLNHETLILCVCRSINNDRSYIINKLTQWGVINSLVNMYSIPYKNLRAAFSTFIEYGSIYEGRLVRRDFTPRTQEYNSKKLNLYPFNYARLMSPTGDVQELHYEYFKSLQNGEGAYSLGIGTMIANSPVSVVAPIDYKYLTSRYSDSPSTQFGIYFDRYPTVAYNTDAYLAAYAAQAQANIRNNTWINQQQRELDVIKANAGMISGVVSTFANTSAIPNGASRTDNATGADPSALGNGISAGLNFANAGVQAQLTKRQTNIIESQDQFVKASYAALTGGEGNEVFEANMAPTKAAYAANIYTPSDCTGQTNYFEGGFQDIKIYPVTLRDEIMKLYDLYFRNFGYASGRFGKPRIFNYMDGNTHKDEELPHFTKTSDSDDAVLSTYVKTSHMKLNFFISDVSDFISTMFDSGVRLYKGSHLIEKGL